MTIKFEGYESYYAAEKIIKAFEEIKEKEHEPVPVWGIIHLKNRKFWRFLLLLLYFLF